MSGIDPTESMNVPASYLDPHDSIDFERFLSDMDSLENPSPVINYLKEHLTTIEVDGKEQEVPATSTTSKNVRLMQLKLNELDPDNNKAEIEYYNHERALTIATFRTLHRIPPMLFRLKTGLYVPSYYLEGLLTSTPKEEAWRSPVLDQRGAIIFRSNEELDRSLGTTTNPEGKVSPFEMGSIVLPRVISILRNIDRRP